MTLCYGWPANTANRWPNFRDISDGGGDVLRCSCGCGALPEPYFMMWLQDIRNAVGFPLIITSGARCPAYNAKVSSTGISGPHTTGLAGDIAIYGPRCHNLLKAAYAASVCGVGDKQHGPWKDRFVHLDIIVGEKRPWKWSYL